MIFRYFNSILLCSALFIGNFASAEVVQAYRTPSDADLKWLLGDAAVPIPSVASPAVIVQTGHVIPKSTKIPMLPGDPCRPAGLPNPPIPPAPQSVAGKMNAGLETDEEGVVNITATVTDAFTPVVQMAGDRIPPPIAVPREQDSSLPVLTTESTVERQPIERPLDLPSYMDDDIGCGSGPYCSGKTKRSGFPCFCLTCVTCGDHRKNKQHVCGDDGTSHDTQWIERLDKIYWDSRTFGNVPDMIGSGTWFTGHEAGITVTTIDGNGAVIETFSSQFTLPTMLLTRPNMAEHFNAGVQNRIWADYRHWHDAVSVYTNNSAVSPIVAEEKRVIEQFTFGLEKQISRDASIEIRMPILYQFGSGSDDTAAAELGNASLFLKQILLQGSRMTFSGGVGTSLPTADDWRPLANARLKNNVHYLVTFIGAQWHPKNNMFGHWVVQTDIPIKKHELVLNGQPSVEVDGQHVIRTGIQLGRWVHRADYGKRPSRFGVFAEVNYAVITKGSPQKEIDDKALNLNTATSIYVSEFGSEKSTLTAAMGMPMVFGKLTCVNSLIMPISGNDRPFSVGYNFSLSRQF